MNGGHCWALPNVVDFSLGPSDGSACDTLGLNNAVLQLNHYNFSITLYPNPASENVTVFYKLPSGSQALFKMYDVLGQTMEKATLQKGSNHYEMNVSKLSAGIYFLQISVDSYSQMKKLIVE